MLHKPLLIPPSAAFWSDVAHALLENGWLADADPRRCDFSGVRVLVQNFTHARLLKSALADHLQKPFIPPRIITLASWLAMLPPDMSEMTRASQSERLMGLYAELRQHAWLKKLFSARRNTDLLPLAQTLLSLFDELTQTLLPSMQMAPGTADEMWQTALGQLPLPMRNILSDEAQLVWSLWKSQLDSSDNIAARFAGMMRLAEQADAPLITINASTPTAIDEAFLQAYAEHQPVLPISLAWHAQSIAPAYVHAWSEILDNSEDSSHAEPDGLIAMPPGLSLSPARSLEEEAQRGAQTIVNWLEEGKSRLAIVAQDRVAARRIRALLERAQIVVADESGWKLSTTRPAAAIAALLDVVATRAETAILLDLLKSPFLCADIPDKSMRVMEIELALRHYKVAGGWETILAVLSDAPEARKLVSLIAAQADLFYGRRTLAEWGAATLKAIEALGMHKALDADAAGAQVTAMLDMLVRDCDAMTQLFSIAEWRAFLNLQLESALFVPPASDQRVVMLQLNGTQLRGFDGVLMLGVDADHLPSQASETLFFANAVRRELGLATRETRHRQQLRDLAGLLSSSEHIVLSWQFYKDGEPNPVSTWIERLQLTLERAGAGRLPLHQVDIAPQRLAASPPSMPSPVAPQLLPRKLSASGYNSLVACPYQFFATRMLGLNSLNEFSEVADKRDYGDWLHEILRTYHEHLRDQPVDLSRRELTLREISQKIFEPILAQSPAALGYYARWQKVIPAYLEWANERERQGWHFIIGTQRFDKTLTWEGGQITLHGTIDRIDENDAGERAVIDYKTRPLQALRDKLKEGEDHQLAFYGLLSDVPVATGHYVALEASRERTGDLAAPRYAEWQQRLETHVVSIVQAIGEGAPLPATGVEHVCAFCQVRGLCRKGAW